MEEIQEKERKVRNYRTYQRTLMQKEMVIERLKEQGCRITKQRLILLDIILEEDCSSCKEIHFKASKMDKRIGPATVYRMINTLEEIGAISRKNMYKIACEDSFHIENSFQTENACTVQLNDNTTCNLSAKKWNTVIKAGLKACGYINDQEIKNVIVRQYGCME